jgi:hypothetical protein
MNKEWVERTGDHECLEAFHTVESKIGQFGLVQLLFLCLHDVRQACIPGFVESQVRRDDHGQLSPYSFHAAVYLFRDSDLIVSIKLNLTRLRCLWPAQQSSKHLTSLTSVIVNALLAQHNQVALLLLNHLSQ